MFGITFETWQSVCNMYFSISAGSLKSYLQWFPFAKLSDEEKKKISSWEFYNEYINPSNFVMYKSAMHLSENFLQKADGSFRDATLVSPILYLVLQAVGKEIANVYVAQRPRDISVYYAGNYGYMRPKYKQDYDDFFKELNGSSDEYQFFIKMDVANFFPSIIVDLLIDRIDSVCNKEGVVFSQTRLQLFKNLLIYCGNGKFPLIENSMASSFLATIIYLDLIDDKLYKYIFEHVQTITSFHMVRYVDDLYILISVDEASGDLQSVYSEIRNEYSSILKDFGLQLNIKKCCIKRTKEISQELKKSLYNEFFNGEKQKIEKLFIGRMQEFINELSLELMFNSVDTEKYNELISKHFSADDIEFIPSEIFNYFVYEDEKELQQEHVVEGMVNLVEQSASFIRLDPKRLTIMILKTHNDRAIKGILNQLFQRNRSGKWNVYDTLTAISYLIQRGFQNKELLKIISEQNANLYKYYEDNCGGSFLRVMHDADIEKLISLIAQDRKACYFYFMHLCEMRQKNYMAAHSLYKNFFDRVTVDFANVEHPKKRIKYNKYYEEKALKGFYKNISNSEHIIQTAHKLRNSNPLSHASAELLDEQRNPTNELKQSIKDLSSVIFDYIKTVPDMGIQH